VTSVQGVGAVLALAFAVSTADASWFGRHKLDHINTQLQGQLLDFTHNHGSDNRLWSESLCQWRDLYVYLPPGFDPGHQYPLILYLHAFGQDEQAFLNQIVERFDKAIVCGSLPPCIVAVPDGSIKGRPSYVTAGSFFINSKAGDFEDYIMKDVWNFLFEHFPIRPEREAHVIMGASMGGYGAFHLGIKYACRIKVIIGVFPAVNLRWLDCHGHYRADFDPCCWGWREKLRPYEVVARFGPFLIFEKQLFHPLYGRGTPEALAEISRQNPIEMLESYDVQPGQLDMFIAYGGKDQFNIDAQVESFLYVARERGLCVGVNYDPKGKHDLATGLRLFPGAAAWLAERLGPYSPCEVNCGR
jgi:S-formylglutathione hydrolase FrmB